MGYCFEGEDFYDAFLSYAHADDLAHNGWVTDFESYLKQTVEAELQRALDVDNTDAQNFSVCRDKTGFPQSGALDEVIDEKVRQSDFLFVFLGNAYLKSEYCLSELSIFRRATGGTIENALKRTYVIVLDQEAVEILRQGEPEQLAEEHRPLWSMLRDVSQKAIRKEDLLRDGVPLPIRSSEPNRFDNTFHERMTPLVQEFTKKLIERRKVLRSQQQLPGHSLTGTSTEVLDRILIGVVPPRLAKARDELIRELGTDRVEVIDHNELREEPNTLHERFSDARLLIQPFDTLKPLFLKRPDPPGGHLGLLKQLFDAYRENDPSTPGMGMLWWEPVPSSAQEAEVPPATGVPDDDAPMEPYDAAFLDEIPQALRQRCSAHDLAAKIRALQPQPSVIAKVWVEWEETDERKIWKAQELVKTNFEKVCLEKKKEYQIDCSAKIEFGDADWEQLRKRLTKRPDGVVIVINENKDDEAVDNQTEYVSSLEDVANRKMFPGIFYMRATGMYCPPYWSAVRFVAHNEELHYDPDELTRFVEHLFEVLYNKYIEPS